MEVENSDFTINGEIVEKHISLFEKRSDGPGSAYLNNDGILLIKNHRLSNKVRDEIIIMYKDIKTIKLREKRTFTPGAIKIYTESKKYYIEKNKDYKLKPFFDELKKRVNKAKNF
jgi:hypothetical protein